MVTQIGTLSGNNTVITDQTNGLVLIDNGSTPQEAQRPITELPILTNDLIDQAADWYDMWDASANQMVRVRPGRASLTFPLADGINDTRTGNPGTANTAIYSAFDHIHPIIAITAPPIPTLVVSSGTLTITTVSIATSVTDEESVTFQLRVQCNIPIHTSVWQAFSIPSIAGYKAPIITVDGTYRSSGTPTGLPPAPYMGNEASRWGNLIYVGGFTENVATTRYITITIKYVIS